MNWLITGGCGFIGVNLINRLLSEKTRCHIRVIDNLSVGQREDLALVGQFEEIGISSIHGAPTHNIELLVGDIRDRDLALKVGQGIDILVHLAAHTGVIPSVENPHNDCEINVFGTLNYLESARKNGISKFIFASSCAPLGRQEPPVHEEKVPKPISPYGASKLAGEAYCLAYHGSFGIQTIGLRFGNVYGPNSGRKSSVIPKFIRQAIAGEKLVIYGDGSQTRDFIYVEDLIDAILSAGNTDVGGEIFQIATHRETSVNEIAKKVSKLIEKLTAKRVRVSHEAFRPGEIRHNFSDISKAREMLGWNPRWTLDQGLEATVKWAIKTL